VFVLQIRHPIGSTGAAAAALLKGGMLKQFMEQVNEGGAFWGWRVTIKPTFSAEYQKELLRANKCVNSAYFVW